MENNLKIYVNASKNVSMEMILIRELIVYNSSSYLIDAFDLNDRSE